MPVDKVLGTLDDVEAGLLKLSAIVPAALALYRVVWGIWKQANPTKTFEDFNGDLLSGAYEVQNASTTWLVAHGWVVGADGHWHKA